MLPLAIYPGNCAMRLGNAEYDLPTLAEKREIVRQMLCTAKNRENVIETRDSAKNL